MPFSPPGLLADEDLGLDCVGKIALGGDGVLAGLGNLDGADERPAPAAARVERCAHAAESGALDFHRLAGWGGDGHAEGGGDAEVDGVAGAWRLVGLLIAQLELAGGE